MKDEEERGEREILILPFLLFDSLCDPPHALRGLGVLAVQSSSEHRGFVPIFDHHPEIHHEPQSK
jgi:hypothetical protein